jgi:hypothetical protein
MLSTTTDDITAWSTLAAVVVALAVSLGPGVRSRLKGPQLEMTVGTEAPHRIATWTKGFAAEGSELRLEVRNKAGRMPARNVRVRLQSIWMPISDGKYEWGDTAIDIIPLQWSSRRFADGRAGLDSDVTDIPGGISDFSEFAYWDRKTGNFEIRDSRRSADEAGAISFGKGSSFRCQLIVTADHMKPIVRVVEVAGGEKLDEVAFSESPPADKTKIWSIVNFIQDLRRDHPEFGQPKDSVHADPSALDDSPDAHSVPPVAGSGDTTIEETDTSEEHVPSAISGSAPESSP